jgi:hypothetical protein
MRSAGTIPKVSRRGLLVGSLGATGALTLAPRFTATTAVAPKSPDPFINVADFGTSGNGTTDDTDALQAAIDTATTGGTVWFPSGTYLITRPLVVSHGRTMLDGNGTLLAGLENAPLLRFLNVSFTGHPTPCSLTDSGNRVSQLIGSLQGNFHMWLYAAERGCRPRIRATGGACHLRPQVSNRRSR